MKTRARLPLLVGALAACAAPKPHRTIEPPVPGAPSPPPAAGSPTETRASPSAAAGAGSDSDFVLSRAAREEVPTGQIDLNIGDRWWAMRASRLKVTEAQVRARDAAITDKNPPRNFWDDQTAREAVATWTALCNECHGGRRTLEDATKMPEPPGNWGQGQGLFFGQRRPYTELFAVINNGGPERNGKESEMPPWRGKLSREMMWSLLYFLEYQSGGIEGRFPPSLYPRMGDDARKSVPAPR